MKRIIHFLAPCALVSCFSQPPEGLLPSQDAETVVLIDMFHKPLPELPLPNDLATRHDPTSATGLRINASLITPTKYESDVRRKIDELDGWSAFQPIVIPFTNPLDIDSVIAGHRDEDYAMPNDVFYVVDVDRDSKFFGRAYHLDLGNGNYPSIVEDVDQYWKNDPRGWTLSITQEEADEDLNRNGVLDLGDDANGNGVLDPGEDINQNGVLDPPEDTDADGILDVPNYLPGMTPALNDKAGRADALMTFYERETNSVILRTMVPLEERTTYAVIVTRRLRDENGYPVGSPYDFVNHTSQTEDLRPLLEVMPNGLTEEGIAFAFTFTTQSNKSHWQAVRDGIYGHGVQAHLAAQFPPKIASIETLRDSGTFNDNPHIIYGEQWEAVQIALDANDIRNFDPVNDEEDRLVAEGLNYVDYFVVGSFDSAQLFQRQTGSKRWRTGLNEESWPPDLDRQPATARSERVYFTLTMPKKEVSARGEGKPAPIMLMAHGYTSNRFNDAMNIGPHFARHGLATLAIDGPSHGLPLDDIERALVKSIFANQGIEATADAILKGRSFDQNNDIFGRHDSGADFWTSYVFHTRDVLRQYVFDFMQLVRILRTFDGIKRWDFDVDGDGTNDFAGDFDGDGVVDIGGDGMINMLGGSLGGMTTMLVSALEPEITAGAPVAGGGGVGDMGGRTSQGGAREGFILRVMGPLYTGTLDFASGELLIETLFPDLNDVAQDKVLQDANSLSEVPPRLALVPGVRPWDTMVVENLSNGEIDCGFINDLGEVRVAVASDIDDRLQISIFDGPQLAGKPHCILRAGAEPRVIIDEFQFDTAHERDSNRETIVYSAGDPLVAMSEGPGLRRSSADLRRFMGLGQLVLDPADPINVARHLQMDPLTYPGTGQTTGTHMIMGATLGDTSVATSAGVAHARAAGFIEYLEDHAVFGKPVNQVLLDNYVQEGIHNTNRYTNAAGQGVHIDIHNFSGGDDRWAHDNPRLDPPLRIGFDERNATGGYSIPLFIFPEPKGDHGFARPGADTQDGREVCPVSCSPGPDVCGCTDPFDAGKFYFNMFGHFLKNGGETVSTDLCHSRGDCPDIPAQPTPRNVATLP